MSNLVVKFAVYGALPGGASTNAEAFDVTQKLQTLINASGGIVACNNNNFGDPAFGNDKHFGALVTRNGTDFYFACDEGQKIDFNAATSDLDSVAGQDWRGVTATDWLGTDSGADELVAVRAAHAPHRADLFVYGNPYHRVQRDTGLAGMEAEFDQTSVAPGDVASSLAAVHANTVNWTMNVPGAYSQLVDFLEATKSSCVDGRQLRVLATLIPPAAVDNGDPCQKPEDSPRTAMHELSFFKPNATPAALCKDYIGWAEVFGRLAQQYPHFVGVQVDDFMNHPEAFPEEEVAEVQSKMRTQAPWMSFLAETYSDTLTVPDIARTVDTLVFYFRNNMHGQCIDGACGENSVWNVPAEIAYVSSFLPAGRKLQVGTYWGTLGHSPPLEGMLRYDFDLMRLIRNFPGLGGTIAYPLVPRDGSTCTELNFTGSKFCILQRLYGSTERPVTHTDLTALSRAPAAAGEPFGYLYAAQGVQNIAYRGTDGHAHELWRTSTGIGTSDLTALAGAPVVVGDVRAYVYNAAGTQNVVYRGTDNNIHGLYWTTGAVGHDNLTALAHAPLAAGSPYPYIYAAANTQNVLYRGTDGHVHGLYWTTGAVGHDDLSGLAHATNAAGNPFAYIYDAFGIQNAMYRGTDGHLHDLYWSTGAVGNDDLTSLALAPLPQADARAYISSNDNLQHAIYGGTDKHVHELYWSTGAVGHDDLTNATHAPAPAASATPNAFFVASDGTHHVIYRDALSHIRELSWTTGGVADDDLTGLTGAPLAAGDPSAYVVPSDGSRHVVYRSADGHIHELLH